MVSLKAIHEDLEEFKKLTPISLAVGVLIITIIIYTIRGLL